MSPAYAKPSFLTRDPIVARIFDRRLTVLYDGVGSSRKSPPNADRFQKTGSQQLGPDVTCPRWQLYRQVNSLPLVGEGLDDFAPFEKVAAILANVLNILQRSDRPLR
jgi:hypothetical protein